MVDAAVERVLVVTAHPDDAEFWAGGTIASWTSQSVAVDYLVLTDGEAGLAPGVDPRSRRAEQEAAAAVLGVHDVEFLGLPEGSLTAPREDLHVEIVRAIRRCRPHRVVTWSPEYNWDRFRSCHPDHLGTGAHVVRAVYPDAGNPYALPAHLHPEQWPPWTVPELWLFNSPQVNHYVDITDVFRQKVEAVRRHVSQVPPERDIAAALRSRLEPNTAAAGAREGRLLEAYQVVESG